MFVLPKDYAVDDITILGFIVQNHALSHGTKIVYGVIGAILRDHPDGVITCVSQVARLAGMSPPTARAALAALHDRGMITVNYHDRYTVGVTPVAS